MYVISALNLIVAIKELSGPIDRIKGLFSSNLRFLT